MNYEVLLNSIVGSLKADSVLAKVMLSVNWKNLYHFPLCYLEFKFQWENKQPTIYPIIFPPSL